MRQSTPRRAASSLSCTVSRSGVSDLDQMRAVPFRAPQETYFLFRHFRGKLTRQRPKARSGTAQHEGTSWC